MENIFEISYHNPVKFYPSTPTPGKGFDDDINYNQIKSWERKIKYYQKWKKEDTVFIQVWSTEVPTIKLIDCTGLVLKSAVGAVVIASPGLDFNIYLCYLTLNDVAEGKDYYFTITTDTFAAISEPQEIRTDYDIETLLFRYTNSINDFGIVWSGYNGPGDLYTFQPVFRIEAAIMNYDPQRERTSFRDQVLNIKTTSATPFDQFKLFIADVWGVAPWATKLLNNIFTTDKVLIENIQYETPDGSKWDITRVHGYPLVGAAIDLLPAKNKSGLQLSAEILPGSDEIIVAYDIDWEAFGYQNAPAAAVEVHVEQTE